MQKINNMMNDSIQSTISKRSYLNQSIDQSNIEYDNPYDLIKKKTFNHKNQTPNKVPQKDKNINKTVFITPQGTKKTQAMTEQAKANKHSLKLQNQKIQQLRPMPPSKRQQQTSVMRLYQTGRNSTLLEKGGEGNQTQRLPSRYSIKSQRDEAFNRTERIVKNAMTARLGSTQKSY